MKFPINEFGLPRKNRFYHHLTTNIGALSPSVSVEIISENALKKTMKNIIETASISTSSLPNFENTSKRSVEILFWYFVH